jgi:hypothetical protein
MTGIPLAPIPHRLGSDCPSIPFWWQKATLVYDLRYLRRRVPHSVSLHVGAGFARECLYLTNVEGVTRLVRRSPPRTKERFVETLLALI